MAVAFLEMRRLFLRIGRKVARINIKLESVAAIQQAISLALVTELNKYLVSRVNIVKPKLGELLKAAILASPEVASLGGGKLQSELGVPDATDRINRLVDIWANSIGITFSSAKLTGNKVTAKVTIQAIKSEGEDVLGNDAASYSTSNNQVINWLEWLMLEGDKQIIRGYGIGIDSLGLARTGLGQIMIESRSKSWGVPPEFAGTKDDNFITRSIENINMAIDTLIKDTFQ